jgi:prepilin peptidase CpaA
VILTTTWVAVVTLALVSTAVDLRTRRVPNVLTLGAAALGVAVHATAGGATQSLFGWLTGLVLFLPLFALGGLGAGDVKLLAAFGAWLGPVGALWAGLWAALVGGLLALAVGASQGYLGQACRNLWTMLGVWRTMGPSAVPGVTLEDARGPRLAYAAAISAGAVLSLWIGGR